MVQRLSKSLSLALFLLAGILIQPTPAQTQDPSINQNGVIGEIKAFDAAAKQLVVKTDGGSLVAVTLADSTTYLRLAPGETSLTNATKITMTDLGEGDRVFARGVPSEDRKSIAPRMVIVMTRADIAKKQEAERAEWRRRGILGVVSALNPATKEITISTRTMAGPQEVIIPVSDTVEMRRYAPDSIKFSDAKVSSFGELQVGDQLRALGNRSPDGPRFTAEKIVTGSFRTVSGTVSAINVGSGEVSIQDLQTKQPLTIVIKQDAVLRRFPPMAELGTMFMGGRGPGGGGGGPGGQPPHGNRSQQPGGGGPGQGPGGGRPGGGFNVQEMLERLPTIALADLKAGDTIVVSSTKGADINRLTAITLVTGADTLLNLMAARQPQGGRQMPDPGAGLGSGEFQIGIGLP
ncbi:MAG TPA: hypothetical protein VJ023_17750 [Pyrinomonadaceae bacterium]|nr:hypothetical protein [Pyrinomonadaceae bacterium]